MTEQNIKVLSWNINSIRIRLEQLKKIVNELNPDIETEIKIAKIKINCVCTLKFNQNRFKVLSKNFILSITLIFFCKK